MFARPSYSRRENNNNNKQVNFKRTISEIQKVTKCVHFRLELVYIHNLNNKPKEIELNKIYIKANGA